MASKIAGLDAGSVGLIGSWHEKGIGDHIVNVGWLRALDKGMLDKVGGRDRLRSELPADWFAKYDYGNGLVIQAGPSLRSRPRSSMPSLRSTSCRRWLGRMSVCRTTTTSISARRTENQA
jgi:hypothetical protein